MNTSSLPLVTPVIKKFNSYYQASVVDIKEVEETTINTQNKSVWKIIRFPMWLGFFAICAIVVGASVPSSPFTVKSAGSWYFGIQNHSILKGSFTPSSTEIYLGLIGPFGGLIVFIRAWWTLYRRVAVRPRIPLKYLVIIGAVWLIPLIMAPPLFSRDSYSYAAQGEMASKGINPYQYGVNVLGENANVYYNQVDKFWQYTPVPYGPVDLTISATIMDATNHVELFAILLLRLVMGVGGIVIAALFFPFIAKKVGVDPSTAFAFGILNPVTLLHVIGGIHNDGIMVGIMVAGIALAKMNRKILGICICALAALIKAPALLAAAFIGWNWPGRSAKPLERFKYLSVSGALSLATMFIVTWLTGFGWGWLHNLNAPNAVINWLSPTTGLAKLFTRLIHLVGIDISSGTVLSIFRESGTVLSLALATYFLLSSHKNEWIVSLGVAFLLVVMLSPVVQPWYLSWGIILMSFSQRSRAKSIALALAIITTFYGLPSGLLLIQQIFKTSPLVVVPSLLIFVALVVWPLISWFRRIQHIALQMNSVPV